MNIRLDLGCGPINMRSKVAPFDALKFMNSSENTLANVAEYLKHYTLWRCCSIVSAAKGGCMSNLAASCIPPQPE
ncbi:TPA: hypothetical protein NOS95_002377 [Pseudomonas aeruginosa]|uniref:hypothetical protein n=1 Tax=Pseudomonas aeruginosa TaxID=287 RepID=UPI0012986B96|nr:hypothetical protein [Pseudomonas aeruginosa]MBU5955487.1 hypothetical protein [Pseudomonas aeruginosa]MBX6041217.1 hypothetical protein [Pseudomonas aeruginosa]MBX6570843.1 hypothetical protein [Pseudomonas aeruginosa]MBX6651395.1 hypothetical protein [Pseudomonas aeruginosa]MBX6806315.1 hypothetical protein [Pseudomonas aeruginosa]